MFRVDPAKPGVWRYSSLLPSFGKEFSLGEALTPIYKIGGVLIKDESRNPTGSYADRASAVIVSHVMGLGDVVNKSFIVQYVEDFTKSVVYYMEHAIDPGRISVEIQNLFEVLVDDLMYFASRNIGLARNTSLHCGGDSLIYIGYFNPLTVEGLKTIVFEVYESNVRVENIVVPAETGLLAYSILKGIQDLRKAGFDIGYNIVAVLAGSQNTPDLLRLNPEIKTVRVSDEEIYEALKTLAQRGIKAKPISAIGYYIAENIGDSMAILSGGIKHVVRSGRRSLLKSRIVETLSRKSPATAYEIWKENAEYTLRGVYKALKSMEKNGEVCYEVTSRGKRKIKLYKLC